MGSDKPSSARTASSHRRTGFQVRGQLRQVLPPAGRPGGRRPVRRRSGTRGAQAWRNPSTGRRQLRLAQSAPGTAATNLPIIRMASLSHHGRVRHDGATTRPTQPIRRTRAQAPRHVADAAATPAGQRAGGLARHGPAVHAAAAATGAPAAACGGPTPRTWPRRSSGPRPPAWPASAASARATPSAPGSAASPATSSCTHFRRAAASRRPAAAPTPWPGSRTSPRPRPPDAEEDDPRPSWRPCGGEPWSWSAARSRSGPGAPSGSPPSRAAPPTDVAARPGRQPDRRAHGQVPRAAPPQGTIRRPDLVARGHNGGRRDPVLRRAHSSRSGRTRLPPQASSPGPARAAATEVFT